MAAVRTCEVEVAVAVDEVPLDVGSEFYVVVDLWKVCDFHYGNVL
jgi:hypothetical protein